jgi:hypothetical protein
MSYTGASSCTNILLFGPSITTSEVLHGDRRRSSTMFKFERRCLRNWSQRCLRYAKYSSNNNSVRRCIEHP